MSLGDARVEGIFRDSAWKYFVVHADQRLKLFQFYITLCTALLAAGGLLIRLEEPKVLLVILGVFSVFVSFIFWKLDLRTKTLVKRGEEALKTLDNLHEIPHLDGEGPSPVKLFERDDFLVDKDAFSSPIMGHFSYSKCFNATFLFVGFLGLLATAHGLGLLASAYGIGIGVFKALTPRSSPVRMFGGNLPPRHVLDDLLLTWSERGNTPKACPGPLFGRRAIG